MNKTQKNRGFSLTEVLLAVATLAVGMLFIGGTFMAGIHLTTISTERTTAAVVADEAFAKVRLYGLNPNDPNLSFDRMTPFDSLAPIAGDEMMYPSTRAPMGDKQYSWVALCRKIAPQSRLVQVTVFVCRKVGTMTEYWIRDAAAFPALIKWPMPRPVPVSVINNQLRHAANEIQIEISADPVEETFIDDGYTIVDARTGRIYQVAERYADTPDTVRLRTPWNAVNNTRWIWVVPPPVGGGRKPCIAVYQKEIRF